MPTFGAVYVDRLDCTRRPGQRLYARPNSGNTNPNMSNISDKGTHFSQASIGLASQPIRATTQLTIVGHIHLDTRSSLLRRRRHRTHTRTKHVQGRNKVRMIIGSHKATSCNLKIQSRLHTAHSGQTADRRETADSRQQASSKQQAASSKQQAASSKQQTASSRQRRED